MICPQCGKEMRVGRMTAGGYWIRWVSEEPASFPAERVTISPFSLSAKGVPAYLCDDCRKAIVEY